MNKDAIIAKAAEAFNKVRPGLMPGARFFLLKRAQHSSQFLVIAEITSGFWGRWSDFREQMRFMWADTEDSWADKVAQTTEVGFGVPDTTGKIDVYPISPDARDRVSPSGGSLFWKLYGIREGSERFSIPVVEEPEPEP